MDDFLVFQLLLDPTVSDKTKNRLRKAFNAYDIEMIEQIIDDILLIKTTNVLLKMKHDEV